MFKKFKIEICEVKCWGIFFCPMDENIISLLLNGVLENGLCKQSSNLGNGTLSVCLFTHLFNVVPPYIFVILYA